MNDKRACVLLHGGVNNDARVIKFTRYFSQFMEIDLFYINQSNAPVEDANKLFENQVKLYPLHLPSDTLKIIRILKSVFFWRKYDFMIAHVLKEGHKYDLIIANDLPTLRQGALLKAVSGNAKLLYDSHEIYLETVNQFYPKIAAPVKKMLFKCMISLSRFFGQIAEKKYLKQADFFTTVNNSLADYFKKKYDYNSVLAVMNCPPYSEKKPVSKINFRKIYGFDVEDKIFLYQGVLNLGRGLHLLIEAFKLVLKSNNKIKLVIIGYGVLEYELQNKVQEAELGEHIKFFGAVPNQYLINYTTAADFGVNLLEPFNLSKKLASPNKLFEYMQAEIPVLCSYSPENDLVFKNFKIGRQCENKPESIATAITALANEEEQNLKKYFVELCKAKKLYNWEKQSMKLKSIVESLIS
ncbi:MAG: glycosyltransferase [Chitinophagales bacterium]